MAKKVREGMWIYIAPGIKATLQGGVALVCDERNDTELDLTRIEDKIIIYERQVKEWFLDIANNLNGDSAGFVVLMVATSYIESVQQNYEGKSSQGGSKTCFVRGFKRIVDPSADDKNIKSFYNQVRNGLFHNGMTKSKVIIETHDSIAVDFSDPDIIKIDPHLLIKQIYSDFKNYITKLNDINEMELRRKFDRSFSNVIDD